MCGMEQPVTSLEILEPEGADDPEVNVARGLAAATQVTEKEEPLERVERHDLFDRVEVSGRGDALEAQREVVGEAKWTSIAAIAAGKSERL